MTTISINQVTDPKDRLTDHHKSTFASANNVEIIQLNDGDCLWRFISKKKGRIFSDCWIDSPSMNYIMQAIHSTNSFSQQGKKKVVRDNLAVLENWNSNLSWRVKILFKKPVVAYKGKAGPQKFFVDDAALTDKWGTPVSKSIEHRIGGLDQYLIPRFSGITADQAAEFATVTYFAHI
jgi:hypothetical protein